jgi:hypothetical protein
VPARPPSHPPPPLAITVALALAFAAGPVLPAPQALSATDPSSTPSAEDLWNTYPLNSTPEPSSERKPMPSPAASLREVRGPERSGSDGDGPPAPLVVLAVLAGGGSLLFWLRRRSLRGPPAPAPRSGLAGALDPGAPLPSSAGARAGMRTNGPRRPRPAAAARRRDTRAARRPHDRPPRPAAGGRRAEQPAAPPDPRGAWAAEIEWGHAGELRFRAIARQAEDAEGIPVAESPALEWPPGSPAAVEALTGAVEQIEASMLVAGWTPLAPGSAWYAKRFAWKPAPAAPATPTAAEHKPGSGRFARSGWPDGSEQLWRCEIRWATGYISSRFEAVAFPPGARRGGPVGASPSFKWLLRTQPELYVEEHRAEVRRLATSLAAAGWERAGQGEHWYEARFVWPREGRPPDHVGSVAIDGEQAP